MQHYSPLLKNYCKISFNVVYHKSKTCFGKLLFVVFEIIEKTTHTLMPKNDITEPKARLL